MSGADITGFDPSSGDRMACDVDGVIHSEPPGKKRAFAKTALMTHALAGAQQSLIRVAHALVDVDVTIGAYADLLARAQPLNSGRVVIVFSGTHRVLVDGVQKRDVVPVPMRMVLYPSGIWKLRRPPPYTKLEELRVGRDLPQSDRLVVQILRELDKLFLARTTLMGFLTNFRGPVIPATQSAVAVAESSLERITSLKARLRSDWLEDAKGCREAIRAERKQLAEKRKEAAIRKRNAAKQALT
jgi:hypothetical protein